MVCFIQIQIHNSPRSPCQASIEIPGGREIESTYINSDQDIQLLVLAPRLPILVEFLRRVMSHDERILGQFLEEAFRRRAFDVEV